MKALFAVSVLVVVFKEGLSMPMEGGLGALPPMFVRSAVFENTLQDSITVEVTFESKKTKSYEIVAGKNVDVEGVIDHGSFTTYDPITSFKVTSWANGGKKVPVSSSSGIEIHKYTIGQGDENGLQITKTLV